MITPQQFRNPQVKPKWQLPVGVIESVVAFNCRKYGFPRPVLAMPMWEGAGNRALDYSGYGNHGILTNGPVWTIGGIGFDGNNDCIAVGDPASLDFVPNVDEFSLSVWFKGTEQSDIYYIIAGKWAGNQQGYGIWIRNTLEISAFSGGITAGLHSGVNLDGNWHHVVLTNKDVFGTLTSYIYVDGVLKNSTVPGAETGGSFDIGARIIDGDRFFKGIINNPMVFRNALSAAQVSFLYNNPHFIYRTPEELYGSYITIITYIPRIIMF